MCVCDWDGPDVSSRRWQKARKEHRCGECWRTINVGERYEVHTGLYEGKWETYRWCAHCSASQKIYAEVDECECWLYGDLWSPIQEAAGDMPSFSLWRLCVGVKRRWVIHRGLRKGQLMPVPELSS